MLATSAYDQDRPTLVLFAHIALQVQIMLRICFNRDNSNLCLWVRPFWAPLNEPYRGPWLIPRPAANARKIHSEKSPVCRKTFWPQGIGRLNLEKPQL